jgi:hypothetical protein
MTRSVIWLGLAAALCAGCVGSPVGIGLTAAAMNRYNDVPYDGRKGDTRFADYQDCVATDNTSWDVIDACMAKKGYTVKQ